MNSYALLIPIFNEERTVPILVKKLKKLDKNITIILINDGSTDNTHKLIKHLKFCKILLNQKNVGKGASIIKGLSLVQEKNVIIMDGDDEIDINQISNLIKIYEQNKKIILLGTRWNTNIGSKYDINLLGNYIINVIFNFLFRSNFNDILCCLKIIDSKVLRSFSLRSKRFTIETEIMAKIAQRKLPYQEIKVKYSRRNRNEGKKLKFSDGFKILYVMLNMYVSKKFNLN
jgi:dolichol-phosphate mannosyltransferase